jgi:hypothetical protein
VWHGFDCADTVFTGHFLQHIRRYFYRYLPAMLSGVYLPLSWHGDPLTPV